MDQDKVVNIEKYRDELTAQKLLESDPGSAEKALNKLPLHRKVELVLSAPWEKRMELILLAENARELVQALPEEEMYWTVKQRGEEDSLALISLTNHDQFQYMVDIDCWRKDSIDAGSVALWYRLLSKCHESKVMEWMTKADDEFLICSLKKFVHITKMQDETDISEEYELMPSACTIDNIYYFSFSDDEARLSILPVLSSLYQNYRGRFYSLVEGVIWDSAAEAEEDAFYWRQKRTSEHGFPELDEALAVYQHISDKEVKLLTKGSGKGKSGKDEDRTDSYALKLRFCFSQKQHPSFLMNVIALLDSQQVFDALQRNIVHLANKVIIADALEPQQLDDMKRSLNKVMGYVNIGLEVLSAGDVRRAKMHLEHVHPEILFRIGFSRIMQLQKKAESQKSTIWLQDRERFASFFDTPWAEAVLGLTQKRPSLFEGIVKRGAIEYKNFECLDEIQALDQVIDAIAAAQAVLFTLFSIKHDYLFSEFLQETALNDVSELKCSAVFLTVLANHILKGKTELSPLTSQELIDFLEMIFSKYEDSPGCFLKKGMYDECMAWLSGQYGPQEQQQAGGLSFFVSACLTMLEEEFSQLAAKKVIDNRYVTGILLKRK